MLGYNNSYATVRSNVGFNSNYNSLGFLVNVNSTEGGQGNTGIPTWAMNLGGNVPDNDSFYIERTAAGSFTFNQLFKITGTGNVGIGTTSPSEKLRVNGTFSSNALWTDSSGLSYWGSYPTAYGVLTWDTGYAHVYATSGQNLRLGANGSNINMIINTSGNVGIGTNNPLTKLHVAGDVYIPTGQSYWINATGDSGDRLRLHHSSTNSYIDYASGDLFFRPSSTTKITFKQSGEVWINYTSDQGDYFLQVNGNVLAGAYYESSDITKKDVIETNPTTKLDIDVIKFTRKRESDVRYGYSAQQIMEIAPELVDNSGEAMGVKYLDVHTLKIAALEREVGSLKDENKTLKQILADKLGVHF
jgi:hypothetical protein